MRELGQRRNIPELKRQRRPYVTHSPDRMTGSVVPSLWRPSTSSSPEPIMKSTCAPRTSYGWQANLVWGASPRQTPYTLSRALLRHARSVLVAHSLRSFAPYMESVGCGTDRRLTNDGQSGASRVASGFSRKFSEIYSLTAFNCRRRSQKRLHVVTS